MIVILLLRYLEIKLLREKVFSIVSLSILILAIYIIQKSMKLLSINYVITFITLAKSVISRKISISRKRTTLVYYIVILNRSLRYLY